MSIATLLALVLAESNGQVHKDDDNILLLPKPIQFSANNSSRLVLAGDRNDTSLQDKDIFPDSWVSDLFYRALANFTMRRVGSTACQQQVDMYVKHLKNYTDWAVRSELILSSNNYCVMTVNLKLQTHLKNICKFIHNFFFIF